MALADDIATELGVSPATVRNVLSGRNKELWPSTKRRADEIRAAASKRRYRINTAARATATGRFNNIALVLSSDDWNVHIFRETLLAIRAAARKSSLNLVLGDLPSNMAANDQMPDFLRELSADGLLVSSLDSIVDSIYSWIDHYHIPAIWLNVKLPGNCVFPNDLAGGRQAVERLLNLGHRSIVYLDNSSSKHYSQVDRKRGYESVMVEWGLAPRIVDLGPAPRIPLSELLMGDERPTAAVVYSWEHAVALYGTALRQGLRVPEDLSIITFHSWPVDITDVPISTMVIPASEMGTRGFDELKRKIDDPAYSASPISIDYRWAHGATIAAP